jgi:hypothetical protein
MLYVAWLVLVAVVVLVSGTSLPPTVASHFAGSGEADAFMTRAGYLGAMCFFAAGVPAIMVLMTQRMVRRSPQRINLPRREYWLAPQRREATLRELMLYMMQFGVAMSLLIAFAHWEVVQANLRMPPRLATERMIIGIGVFVLATGWWLYRLHARFRRVPRA